MKIYGLPKRRRTNAWDFSGSQPEIAFEVEREVGSLYTQIFFKNYFFFLSRFSLRFIHDQIRWFSTGRATGNRLWSKREKWGAFTTQVFLENYFFLSRFSQRFIYEQIWWFSNARASSITFGAKSKFINRWDFKDK